jgi:WD40 repeat protein
VGKTLVVATFGGNAVSLWEAGGKKPLWKINAPRARKESGVPMSFSGDGKLFAVENELKIINVYETLTGKHLCKIPTGGQHYWSLRLSPDGKTLATSNWDGHVRLWDLPSGKQRAQLTPREGWTADFSFSPDSKTLLIGGPNSGHGLQLWETATGKRIEPFPGHRSGISSIAFAPDGRTVATSSSLRGDPVIRLWNPDTGELRKELLGPDSRGISTLMFSPDGKTLAAAEWISNATSRVWIWDVARGRIRHTLTKHEAPCSGLAFSPNGKHLASGDCYYNRDGMYFGRLCIWDTQAGKLENEIRDTKGMIRAIVFSLDGKRVYAAADGVYVYEVETGKRIGDPMGKDVYSSLMLSPDGRLLFAGGGTRPVTIWELHTRREINLGLPRESAQASAFAPDGRTMAFRTANGDALLCDWPSRKVGETFAAGGDWGEFAFSPDGRRLATSSFKHSDVLIFDVSGLTNRPLGRAPRPSDQELQGWWDELRHDDPSIAYWAAWQLTLRRQQSVPFLATKLQPARPIDPAIARLIAQLDDEVFEKRQQATAELEKRGEAIAGDLRKAFRISDSLEQKGRLGKLLAKLGGNDLSPEEVRGIRAVAALERIGGPEVRKILESLAKGASAEPLTREAAASLARLAATRR